MSPSQVVATVPRHSKMAVLVIVAIELDILTRDIRVAYKVQRRINVVEKGQPKNKNALAGRAVVIGERNASIFDLVGDVFAYGEFFMLGADVADLEAQNLRGSEMGFPNILDGFAI